MHRCLDSAHSSRRLIKQTQAKAEEAFVARAKRCVLKVVRMQCDVSNDERREGENKAYEKKGKAERGGEREKGVK